MHDSSELKGMYACMAFGSEFRGRTVGLFEPCQLVAVDSIVYESSFVPWSISKLKARH